jgi:hypothetical protein
MQPVTGYYFVIQYCPDASRLEAANVGVVLFCPEPFFLKARTVRGNDRIRRFFRPRDPDWVQINLIKRSIEERLTVDRDQFRNLASLEHFAATRANDMRLTKGRAVLVENPEEELNCLFDRLVGEGPCRGTARIRRILARAFRAEDIAPFIEKNVSVSLPLFHLSVEVPYGFRNGRFNLIQPAQFRGLSPVGILRKAGEYALQGDLLYRHPDPGLGEMQLLVVGQFAREQKGVAAAVREVLRDRQTELYTTREIDRLLEVIRNTGRPVTEDSPR